MSVAENLEALPGTPPDARRFEWLSRLVGLALVVVTIALWQALAIQQRDMIDDEASTSAQSFATGAEREIALRVRFLEYLAERWGTDPEERSEDWFADTSELIRQVPSYRTVERVDSAFRIQRVIAFDIGVAGPGTSRAPDERHRDALRVVRSTGMVAYSRTFELAQGGAGFGVYVPIYVADRFDGVVVGVLEVKRLLDAIWPNTPIGYDVSVYDRDKLIYGPGNGAQASPHAHAERIALGDLEWELRLEPTALGLARLDPPVLSAVLVVGLLIALLTAQLVRALGSAQHHIAERRRAEEKSRMLYAELRALFDHAPINIVMTDLSGRYLMINRQWEQFHERSAEDMIGKSPQDIIDADHAKLLRDQELEALNHGNPEPAKIEVTVAGETKTLIVHKFAIRDENGAPKMYCGMGIDITSHERAEAAFQTVVEAAPYGMIMADSEGRIALVNRMTETLLGYTRDELVGQPIETLLPRRYRDAHGQHREGFKASPTARMMGIGRDLTALHKSGVEVPVEIGLMPVKWNGQSMVVAAVTDVTTRRMMEDDIRQANQRLEEFSYVASHDLKAPLRGIASLVEWILEDLRGDEPESVTHNLKRIGVRVENLERLINDLLAYARTGRTSGKLDLTDPAQMIEDVLAVQPPPPGFDVDIRCRAKPFKTDKTPIETVLRNLIGNAYKHHGGTSGKIIVTVEDEDPYCLFTVSDDGQGVPEQARGRVFQIFQTLSTKGRHNSGLGLTISKSLVEAHGGRIALTATSEDGHGATFRVWWPSVLRKEITGVATP